MQTALLSAPDEHVHDGRTIVFGALSFEELRRDAADAEEDSPLHAVHASILAHQESHASSEDPDKGEWSVPLTLRAELFFAKSHVDAAAHKAEVTAKRQAAVVAAREAARGGDGSPPRRRARPPTKPPPPSPPRHAAPRSTPASRGRPRFQTAKRHPRPRGGGGGGGGGGEGCASRGEGGVARRGRRRDETRRRR